MIAIERLALKSFEVIKNNFLGNNQAEKYEGLVDGMINYPVDLSKKQREHFH